MWDSNSLQNRIGFSSGALELGHYRKALSWLRSEQIWNVELSALRLQELQPLVEDLDSLDLDGFEHISFHAPSSFPEEAETLVVSQLREVAKRGWNIVVHPDVIYKPRHWRIFGDQLLIENMDRRKPIGRKPSELNTILAELPKARLCLDVAHARELDPSMTLLKELSEQFQERIAEIHISELDKHCRHLPMTDDAVYDYQSALGSMNPNIPVIIESMLDSHSEQQRFDEYRRSAEVFEVCSVG